MNAKILKTSTQVMLVIAVMLSLVASLVHVQSARAAFTSITPITWNVIGLDSNKVVYADEVAISAVEYKTMHPRRNHLHTLR